MRKEPSASSRIEAALREATGPMTVTAICQAVWGQAGVRERGLVRVNLHRLDERGLLVKHAAKYEITRG